MKSTFLFVLIVLILALNSWSLNAHSENLILSVGDERLLFYEKHSNRLKDPLMVADNQSEKWKEYLRKKLWIENGKIIKVHEHQGKVVIKALRPGVSLMKWGEQEYEVQALNPQQAQTFKLLQEEIKKTKGLSLCIENATIFLRGELQKLVDWLQLAQACQKISKCIYQTQFKLPVPENLKKEILLYFQNKLKELTLPAFQIEFADTIYVRITDQSPYREELHKLLSRFGIQIISGPSIIDLAPLIRVKINVAEVKRDFSQQYGIKWPSSYRAQILPETKINDKDVFADINFLENQGLGKVLASPTLLCRSGKEAEFFAGGEFPIKVVNYRLNDVVWKKYGISLKLSPIADQSGHMSIGVETEISSIDNSRAVDGIPSLHTNRIQSFFDLAKARTIALSGLIKKTDGNNQEGWPGLSSIPLIGAIFSSRQYLKNESELIIFVRPEIFNPQDPNSELDPKFEEIEKQWKVKSEEANESPKEVKHEGANESPKEVRIESQ